MASILSSSQQLRYSIALGREAPLLRPRNVLPGGSSWRSIPTALRCQLEFGSVGDKQQLGMSRVLQQTASLELPILSSRFSPRLHPDLERLREESDAWGLSLFPHSDWAAREAYLSNGRYHLSGAIYPGTCSFHRLTLLAKINLVYFIFDDMMELCTPQEAVKLMGAAKVALKGGAGAGCGATAGPQLANATAAESQLTTLMERYRVDVWEEMCRDMRPAFRERLEGTMLAYMCANLEVEQRQHSNAKLPPHDQTLDEYMACRILFGGGGTFFQLLQYGLGIDIEDQLPSNPNMAQLLKAVLNHCYWVNDLFSFHKEVAQEGGHGRGVLGFLVAQAATAAGDVNLQDIMNKLGDMIQQEEEHIAGLADEIKGQFAASSDVVKFVEAVCATLAGNIYWHTTSGRYKGPSNRSQVMAGDH